MTTSLPPPRGVLAPRAVRRPGLAARPGLALRGLLTSPGERTTSYLVIAATVIVLSLVGLVMVLSASSVRAYVTYGSSWYFFIRQGMWLTAGAFAMLVMSRIDYQRLRVLVGPLLVVTTFLLLLVLVPGLGVEVGGAKSWLGFGSMRFQPSELAKLTLLLYGADVLSRRTDRVQDWRSSVRPVLTVFALLAGLIMLQPDLGTTLALTLVFLSVLWMAGTRMSHMAAIVAVGALPVAYFMSVPFRRDRLTVFLHPWNDPSVTGYQVVQSMIALGSGEWTGVGLGNGRAKWFFLPNAHNDFIFAIIGEELGIVGCASVLLLFVLFAVHGMRTALRAPDRFGQLVATGVTAWVVGQALINIGAVLSLLPVTGLPLPFVSFGGSALLITMGAVGTLLNIARQTAR
jgi:cell division protein FtsW